MTSNERTSKRVAHIAARVLAARVLVLRAKQSAMFPNYVLVGLAPDDLFMPKKWWGDIRALAASCLTQSPDKPKRKPAKRRK